MQLNIPIKNITIFIIMLLTLLPVQKISGFEVPVIYSVVPILIYLPLLILINKIIIPTFPKIIFVLFILIIIEIFISTYVNTLLTLGELYFPNDIIHYVVKALIFIYLFVKIFNYYVNPSFFIKLLIVILTLGMLIGILQWLPWPGNSFFIKMYPFRDGSLQLSLIGENLSSIRIHGWAQHATANGGLAMMAFIVAISNILYGKAFKKTSIFLAVISIVNIVISQARAGMLALVFSILLLYIINTYLTNRKLISTLKYLISLVLVGVALRILYVNENPFVQRILYRWEALFETSGGARVDQMKYAISLIDTPFKYLFGISRAVQSNSSNYFHIEVEPVNILVLTGVLGFILHYGLVLILVIYFTNNIRKFKSSNNQYIMILLVSSLVVLLSYQVFSSGYFFFREIRVGVIPWLLFGATVGYVELLKVENLNGDKQ